jgi:ubiquinone/menaquinone biosynthesis C-methylase UbiE
MSWDVQDQDWLTEPTPILGSGPLDPLDGHVLGAMAPAVPPAPAQPAASSDPGSYESAGLVADDAPPVETPDFHIPTLAFGVKTSDSAELEPGPAPAVRAPVITAPHVTPSVAAPAAGADGLVIPALSRLKWVPAPSSEVEVEAADGEAEQESPEKEAGHPEMLEHVDSSELELVAADDDSQRHVPEPEVAFVIPTLARPEPAERLEISLEPAARGDELVIPTLRRAEPPPEAEVTRAPEPRVAPDETEPHEREPDAPIVPQTDEVEEFEEVEAEAIESLDVGDLVESETVSEAEPEHEEARPPSAPPDAKSQQKRRKAWYDDVFAEHFSFLNPATWDETAQRDAQFIHDQLGLREGANVLDVGCGDGRHAIELAKLGLHVTGLDNSLAMLLAAAAHKEAAGVDDKHVTFMHGDMRRLPRDREFEAVICVGTTFGYFEEEQNRQCLQEMFERLAVGGRLLLHVFNRDFVAPHLPSRSWWQGRRCMVIDEAEMNFFANRLRVHRTIIFDDGRQFEHFMFMRAYTVQDIGKAISQLGLRVVEVSGSRDTRARFYGSASPDIWIVAERK